MRSEMFIALVWCVLVRVSFCFNEDLGGMGKSGPAVQRARRNETSAGRAREPGYRHL